MCTSRGHGVAGYVLANVGAGRGKGVCTGVYMCRECRACVSV